MKDWTAAAVVAAAAADVNAQNKQDSSTLISCSPQAPDKRTPPASFARPCYHPLPATTPSYINQDGSWFSLVHGVVHISIGQICCANDPNKPPHVPAKIRVDPCI
jgi:hypothetical protein